MAERRNSKKEEENLWNAVLSESLTANKFPNSNILILGDKNTGKRALLNALQDISETEIPSKSGFSQFFIFYSSIFRKRRQQTGHEGTCLIARIHIPGREEPE